MFSLRLSDTPYQTEGSDWDNPFKLDDPQRDEAIAIINELNPDFWEGTNPLDVVDRIPSGFLQCLIRARIFICVLPSSLENLVPISSTIMFSLGELCG